MKVMPYISLFIFLSLIYCIVYFNSVKEINVLVRDKDRITIQDGDKLDSKYLVFTDVEVFENTDNWMFLKFNSSDIQNNLERNKSYKVKVCGWRIQYFSMYRNIISIEKVNNKNNN